MFKPIQLRPVDPREARPSPQPKHILIVDDDSNIRAIVRRGLEQRGGYVCEEAENGLEAIEKAKRVTPDLVVLDMAMPVMNGFEAAMVLQRELPKVPVVILTMYAEEFGSSLAAIFGVKAIIPKSEGMSILIEHVQKLLGLRK